MAHRYRWGPLGLAMAAALTLGCQIPGENRPHITLGPGAEQLRAAFNADSGAVRVVLLLAPT